MPDDQTTLSIRVMDAKQDVPLLIFGLWALIVVIVATVFFMSITMAPYIWAIIIINLIMIPLLILVIKMLRSTIIENNLVKADKLPALEVNSDGINGSIVLLLGNRKEKLVQQNQARFSILWTDIADIEVMPSSGSGSSSSAACILVRSRDDFNFGSGFYIRRDVLYGQEKKLIDFIENMSGVKAKLNDQLR